MLLSQTEPGLSSATRRRALAALLLAIACTRPADRPLTFAPAAMDPRGRYTAAVDGGVTFWGEGALRLHLHCERGPIAVAVEARGHVVDDVAPALEVRLDGVRAGTVAVVSPELRTYVVTSQLDRSGEVEIELAFTNALEKGDDPLAGRNLYLQRVSVGAEMGTTDGNG